ncbi:formylmethanofuran--tetrahydromethanopterin N-formyltransferase [Pseudodesulfovibrio sp. JC047]|uniref:formylmethanofuran--tetrahydromethanopterin N-formyltransferase n=1 Tax=Pseudodesulfovibrio sp. JC047 TaxID=2683199 RepID=UPI0013D5D855|nr:formylmethanofuran--tetrahydromethanopterin N-formyltransferase [Pseudodesulfovibrio sp. JC047]NDV19426.1 formylmethanofuran--tetrahydromethanopterin N-formyltransferase [Pseudodesulfovibrio sp. JC047]
MRINNVEIVDTFAEAFPMAAARVTITAKNEKWAMQAAQAVTGFATSVIGCGIEAGIDGVSSKTPDGRPGLDCLFFGMSAGALEKQMLKRIGQAIMTTPTSACFDGGVSECPADERTELKLGGKIRYFGDGFQASKVINDTRYWRIPVMEGEFLIQESFTMVDGIGGGNFMILAESDDAALAAAEAAVERMKEIRGVALPFPGGIVRSGSQVGSKYAFLPASTNVAFCPTIRSRVPKTEIPKGVNSVMEIVIDALTYEQVAEATRVGIEAACLPGVMQITAGNYGGKLGKHHFHLQELLG